MACNREKRTGKEKRLTMTDRVTFKNYVEYSKKKERRISEPFTPPSYNVSQGAWRMTTFPFHTKTISLLLAHTLNKGYQDTTQPLSLKQSLSRCYYTLPSRAGGAPHHYRQVSRPMHFAACPLLTKKRSSRADIS